MPICKFCGKEFELSDVKRRIGRSYGVSIIPRLLFFPCNLKCKINMCIRCLFHCFGAKSNA